MSVDIFGTDIKTLNKYIDELELRKIELEGISAEEYEIDFLLAQLKAEKERLVRIKHTRGERNVI